MNKHQLVSKLADRLDITDSASKKFINAFLEVVTETLQQDESLMLQGFGTFSPWKQKARLARNPKTGVACMIEPRTSAKFKVGTVLMQKLNT